MGNMNEPIVAEQQEAFAGPDFTKARFEKLAKGYCDGKTEVELKTGLNLIKLYAGVFEGSNPTNCIINVANPWDVRVSWCLTGPLKELICGKWCAAVHLESIGDGKEFTLKFPHFDFNCAQECFSVCIPGGGIEPDDCGTPYKAVVTVTYESMCGKAGPICGFVELPMLQFYHSEY